MIDDVSLENLARHLRQASETNFTGNIQINFYKGGISNIVKEIHLRETLEIRSIKVLVAG